MGKRIEGCLGNVFLGLVVVLVLALLAGGYLPSGPAVQDAGGWLALIVLGGLALAFARARWIEWINRGR